jgi:alpha-D-ribose 1-methylphosphonate 5-phosphate C-P lyase
MIENLKFQESFNYAYIDEFTKKEIRRKTLKAVCIPGYQVPYSSPEMPISRGWGTGGLHLTLSLVGPKDVVKVIDQGSDASVNACNLRLFIQEMAKCDVTFDTAAATLIQTRHRVPEEILTEEQILVLQVPQPEPLRGVERHETKTRIMHAEADYAKLWVTLYEAYVRISAWHAASICSVPGARSAFTAFHPSPASNPWSSKTSDSRSRSLSMRIALLQVVTKRSWIRSMRTTLAARG